LDRRELSPLRRLYGSACTPPGHPDADLYPNFANDVQGLGWTVYSAENLQKNYWHVNGHCKLLNAKGCFGDECTNGKPCNDGTGNYEPFCGWRGHMMNLGPEAYPWQLCHCFCRTNSMCTVFQVSRDPENPTDWLCLVETG
jgi:hypothetical protein